jgi:hypothetical protein
MTDHGDQGHGDYHGHEDDTSHEDGGKARSTAPQSPYTSSDVRTGAMIALVGLVVVFAIPILLTVL